MHFFNSLTSKKPIFELIIFSIMKYTRINPLLFIKNRIKFISHLKSNSLAVFNSNDIYPVSADSTLPFKQHSDILYLSGIDQEESILLLFPDAKEQAEREILFVKETNEHIAVWEGHKLTKTEATQTSGIQTIYWISEFEVVFKRLLTEAKHIYLNSNEHPRHTTETETREDRFIKNNTALFSKHSIEKSNPILHQIRSVKEPEEIALIQHACNITEKGFRRILPFVKPNITEYEIEAEFIHEFIRNRSRGFAYTPIIASGKNATILHYTENNQICKNGDLLLLDVAAEYANYCSDLTRTIPVSGKFTTRQKEVYNAVLRVKNYATSLLKPGLLFADYNQAIGELMTKELVDLKLLSLQDVKKQTKEKPAYKKYFMHGTSHFLGLDTHDYGDSTQPMQANMVLTVEPGIYIPEENTGVRIEDDVVIQPNGEPINLMKNIPIEIEEIEDLMNK